MMLKTILAVLVMLSCGAAGAETLEALKADSGVRFAEGSPSAGENALLQKTIDESPTLTKMFKEAEENRTWRDVYEGRIVAAAVASWGSNMRAGYIKGTAAAYATFETAPPIVNVIAAIPLWVAGVVYGAGLGLIGSAVTGRF